MLESLTLKPPGGQGDRNHRVEICTAPNLRSISLQCLYLRSIMFAWHLLTDLDLESFYIDETLEILRQAGNLVHLNLRRILGGDDSHMLPSERIVMSSLSSLTLVNDKVTDLSTLLDKITLPELRKLSYSGDGITHAPCLSLSSVLGRSSCALESLSLKQCTVVDGDYEILLNCISSLKELRLEMHDGTTYVSRSNIASLTDHILRLLDPSFARPNRKTCLLPNLEILSYTGLKQFSWAQMLQMVESRTVGISTRGAPTSVEHQPGSADPASTCPVPVRLREVNLCLTLATKEQVSALMPAEPLSARDTGLKWSLETIVKM